MRCKFCDYCPTAPSLSLVNPHRGVKLAWSDEENGWTCGNQCGIMDTSADDEDEEDDLEFVEYVEGETTLPPT